MDSFKLLLVIGVIVFAYYCRKTLIDGFFPQIQGLPFKNDLIDGNLYMCKDENDVPYSCHGQGVSAPVFNKYKDSSYDCPKNWLLPGNSIYT